MANVETSAPSVHIKANFSAIPLELQERDHWVCWKLEERDGKPTKVPYQPNGWKAMANKRSTWCSYDAVVEAEGFHGIGYVFAENDPYVGIDLDGCCDEHGLNDLARSVVRRVASYAEYSQSGRGVHIICRGELPDAVKTDRVEMYDRGRFFVVTGAQLQGSPDTIEPAQAAIDELYKAHKSNGNGHAPAAIADLELGFELTTEAGVSARKFDALTEADPKFKRSWQHKRTDLKDQSNSAYDLSLCAIAVQAGWSDAELYALMVDHRHKYGGVEKCMRADYVKRVIAKVRTKRPDTELVERADLETRGEAVGAFGAVSERLGVQVDELVQYGKTDAVYYLRADGDEIRLGPVADLMSYRVVKNRLLESKGIMLPNMKGYQWEQVIEMMMPLVTHKESDEETRIVSVCGLIDLYLSEHTPGKWRTKDDYWCREPFIKDDHLCIQLLQLLAWAERAYVRYSEAEYSRGLKMLGFERHRTSYRDGDKSKNVTMWRRALPRGEST